MVEKYDKNWYMISKSLGFFCEHECEKEYSKIKAQWVSGEWTEEEDSRLSLIIENNNETSMFECCILMGTRSVIDCRKRWASLRVGSVKKSSWSHQEQIYLIRLGKNCEFSWKKMIKYLPGRESNSVKSFFNSSLRKIKKSVVFKFLKKMISWPVCTNKSKKYLDFFLNKLMSYLKF
jgi:myb proto-oncogene protein